jgi:hypothetical protein
MAVVSTRESVTFSAPISSAPHLFPRSSPHHARTAAATIPPALEIIAADTTVLDVALGCACSSSSPAPMRSHHHLRAQDATLGWWRAWDVKVDLKVVLATVPTDLMLIGDDDQEPSSRGGASVASRWWIGFFGCFGERKGIWGGEGETRSVAGGVGAHWRLQMGIWQSTLPLFELHIHKFTQ